MNAPVHHGIERDVPAGSPARLRLLLVEDNEADAELILATLKRAGYQLKFDIVNEMSVFQESIHRAEYDIIVSDHNLQSWTGMDALEFVRAAGRETPFITVTATLGDEAAVEYIKRGATNYVLKHHLDRLPVALAQALREAALRKEASKLQERISCAKREWELTFDAVPDPMLVIGSDCRIQRANAATKMVFGRPFDQIIGRLCHEVVHGGSEPLSSCSHQRLLTTGQNAQGDIEETHIGKVFHSSTSPLRDPDGSLRGCVHVLRDVTERKKTEEALRRQALTFENIYDAVMVADEEYNITDWNPAATRIFGYSKPEVVGRNVSFLHPPEIPDLSKIQTAVEDAGRFDGELTCIRKDTTTVVVETVIVPLRSESGAQIGTIGVSRDITERKRAENALRESEGKFRMLLDSTAEAIYGLDLNGNCTFCNPATLHFLGYQRVDDLLGKNMHDLIHYARPGGSPHAKSDCDIFRALREGQGTHRDDEVMWRSDGSSFPTEFWSYPIWKDGELAGAVVAFLDISERKTAEKALQESEEKYRELIENASYGIFRATRDGSLLDVNPAFVTMLGYNTKDEALKLNLVRDVYDDPEEREAILQAYETRGRRVAAEVNFRRKDGSLINVRMNGRGVWLPSGELAHFEVIAEDVTQQRILEEQLRQAQKMEAVGRLAGGIAHDFNNVLMVMSSYAEMIPLNGAVGPTVQHYVEQIIKAGRRAAALVSQLLAFSRKQMLHPTVLDLAAVVGDTEEMLSRALGEDIEISIVAELGLAKVYADRSQIEQILMNLAVNARDAMPTGGKLRIELQNVTLAGNYTKSHRNVNEGEYVLLAISDNGVGMDAATEAKIFEPFFTTKPVGKGTGLGLSTVYGIVEQSGGFIWVYSEPGLGSTFKVYLPRCDGEAVAVADPSEKKDGLGGSGETVLLVDDNADLRSAAREFLEARGFQVLDAENGAGALALCSSCGSHIQVLVTDLVMPGMRGAELAAKISQLYPQVKTVYMSGYTDRSEDVSDLGPDAMFLQKPFSLNALVHKLHAALKGSTTSEPGCEH